MSAAASGARVILYWLCPNTYAVQVIANTYEAHGADVFAVTTTRDGGYGVWAKTWATERQRIDDAIHDEYYRQMALPRRAGLPHFDPNPDPAREALP